MSWRRVTLGELCEGPGAGIQTGPFGSQLHAEEYSITGIPVVMPQDLGENYVTDERIARIPLEIADRLDRHRLREGDIVYSRRGDVEKRALVTASEEGWICGTGCLRVRLADRSPGHYKFVSYALADPNVRMWIRNHAVGATMPNLNTTILGAVPVRIPERRLQEGIANILGALDDKIAVNDRLARLTEVLAQSIFDHKTVYLPRVAAGARLDPVLGGTPARDRADYWQGHTPWVSAKDITSASHGVVISTAEHISEEASRKTRARPIPSGSIVLTARGTVGAVARLGVAASFNQSCYGFVSGNVPPSILYFLVKNLVAEAQESAHGSVFDTITMKTFDHVQIPDLDKGSMAALEARLSPLTGLVERAVSESETLSTLRDTLLPALMSGRLSVRDAEDMVSEVV